MQAICKISGLPIYKAPYLIGFDLADIHPIFRAKRKLILTPEMVHKFSKSQSPDEKKIIFLAVLNATELVEFRCAAMPSPATVEANFYQLIHTASWLAFAEHTYKQVVGFPQFVVEEGTKELLTIRNWINALEELKDSIIRKDIDRDRAAALSQKEAEIRKELGEAARLNRAFTPNLARWALDFAELSRNDERYNRYIKILCTPLTDAFVYEIDELRDIESYLEEHLPYDHPQVISVMHQIKTLIQENKKGFSAFAVFSENDPDGETFTILEDDGAVSLSKHVVDIPTGEPKRQDYPTHVAYLVATAKWRLANRERPEAKVAKRIIPSNLTEDSV